MNRPTPAAMSKIKDNLRTAELHVRVTPQMKQAIQGLADFHGITISGAAVMLFSNALRDLRKDKKS